MAENEMRVRLEQVRGLTFVAKADSGHWVTLDGPETFGGAEGASKPLELVLMGLAGCTGMDVVSILTKKRADIRDFQIEAIAKRSDQHPKVFEEVELVYRIHGDVKSKDVERAIELSQEKYCPVAAMLRPSVKLSHRFEIIE